MQPSQQALEQGSHVGIVSVNFVEYHGFSGKPEQPHEKVPSLQHGQERLVDGAHSKWGKE